VEDGEAEELPEAEEEGGGEEDVGAGLAGQALPVVGKGGNSPFAGLRFEGSVGCVFFVVVEFETTMTVVSKL
jgi:hypothetical protein